MSARAFRVLFIHPDLGIGGAERLIVDAAVGLQQRGHAVELFTSHCDPAHSFRETQDGTLKVHVYGDWLPRSMFGRFYALWASVRMIYVALALLLFGGPCDAVVCDQVSTPVPLLRFFGRRVVFYCHFPDKLLATGSSRDSVLARLYRAPLDWLEETTTGCAHAIAVNSAFTQQIFGQHFPRLRRVVPVVLHPPVDTSAAARRLLLSAPPLPDLLAGNAAAAAALRSAPFLLSLNRFERKKNHKLAVLSFTLLAARFPDHHLVIAGGYDPRVVENVEHLDELRRLVVASKLEHRIHLMTSVPDDAKRWLLSHCAAVIYTPANEHFGIVPLEAMFAGRPVIACDSGGPRESVIDQQTGFLCAPTTAAFSAAMAVVMDKRNGERMAAMGAAGHAHVTDSFSREKFAHRLDALISATVPAESRLGLTPARKTE